MDRYNFLLENVTKASLGVGLAFFAFGTSLTAYWVIRHGALSKDQHCSHCLLTFCDFFIYLLDGFLILARVLIKDRFLLLPPLKLTKVEPQAVAITSLALEIKILLKSSRIYILRTFFKQGQTRLD